VTLDERRCSVQGLTIGDGWLLVRNRGTEKWIDLHEPADRWKPAGEGMRFRLPDERTFVLEDGPVAYWLSLGGASIGLGVSGLPNQRRGWRNLQLREAPQLQRIPLDVPYLVPQEPPAGTTADIVFLAPVYFSEKMRIGGICCSNGFGAGSAAGSLPLFAAGLVTSATLSGLRDTCAQEDRHSTVSLALSDAAAVAAVVNSLMLLDVYADRLKSEGLKVGTRRLQSGKGATSKPA